MSNLEEDVFEDEEDVVLEVIVCITKVLFINLRFCFDILLKNVL